LAKLLIELACSNLAEDNLYGLSLNKNSGKDKL